MEAHLSVPPAKLDSKDYSQGQQLQVMPHLHVAPY